MRRTSATVWLIGALLAVSSLLPSCDCSGRRLTLGEVMDLIRHSTAGDRDGDGLPDDVEALLGLNPDDPDTDRDGIPDYVEIFGTGPFDPSAPVPDRNKNGIVAPLDPDDDGNGIIDGMERDSDGDGIPDYLEYYGYTYDWRTGKFESWNGDYGVPYFKTDPHQVSTDQDPYSDHVEATGIHMDVSVRAPGNLPMVPAYPDILVRLEGYAITVPKLITWGQGKSLEAGTSWSRTSGAAHSFTSEASWEVGAQGTLKIGEGLEDEIVLHANYGERYAAGAAATFSVSAGASLLDVESWSLASTLETNDAARVKLFLKVYNVGTAIATDVVPTLNLHVGGHNVATFEPGASKINLLEPGGVYPPNPGVYWTVDTIDVHDRVLPLTLTLPELKALESGAPVGIHLNQLAAKVVLRNPRTGQYESMGDWNEYMARIRAVSAELVFDAGDGNVIRRYVYADDRPTAPRITLADALVWAAGARESVAAGAPPSIRFFDQRDGTPREEALSGWRVALDGKTSRANGFTPEKPPDPGVELSRLRLVPGSVIFAKAPAEKVSPEPRIHYAYHDPTNGGVTAVASDYTGVKSVELVDKHGNARPMSEDVPGSSFFVYYPSSDSTQYPAGYTFDGSERIRVTNAGGVTVETQFHKLYAPQQPEPPVIESVVVDLTAQRIGARVISNVALDAAPAFLRAFYGGRRLCTFERVENFFEDPDGWFCRLEEPWNLVPGIEIVAYAKPGVFTKYVTTAADELPSLSGSKTLASTHCTTRCPAYALLGGGTEGRSDALDLGSGNIVTRTDALSDADHADRRFPEDLWVRSGGDPPVQLHFGAETRSVHIGKDNAPLGFYDLTRDRIANLVGAWNGEWQHGVAPGDVLAVQTSTGRLGKIKVQNVREVFPGGTWTHYYVDLRYVIYLKDCEIAGTCS